MKKFLEEIANFLGLAPRYVVQHKLDKFIGDREIPGNWVENAKFFFLFAAKQRVEELNRQEDVQEAHYQARVVRL